MKELIGKKKKTLRCFGAIRGWSQMHLAKAIDIHTQDN